jgi:F-type H+-transporting ATPase subunit b
MPMHAPSILAQAAQHNPLIPKTFDIVWSVVCVAIITVWFWKYVLPRFDTVLAQRTEKIEGGIERAEQIQADAQAALGALHRRVVAGPRRGGADPGAGPRRRGADPRGGAQHRGAGTGRIIGVGTSHLQAQRARILAELRAELGTVSIVVAGRGLGESLSADGTHSATVEGFLAELMAPPPTP